MADINVMDAINSTSQKYLFECNTSQTRVKLEYELNELLQQPNDRIVTSDGIAVVKFEVILSSYNEINIFVTDVNGNQYLIGTLS